MKNLLAVPVLSIFLFSCSATRMMSLSVQEPAPVTLSPSVKKITVINRSLAGGKGWVLDAVEKVFTLEGVRLDKEGSAASISALTDELAGSKRFDEVKHVTYSGPGNTNPGSYAPMLDWESVQKICRDNGSDILFSLELFDTDSKINYAAYPVKVNTPLGKVPAVHQEATMTTWVKTGWRIYDPQSRKILDEAALSRHLVFRGRGLNPVLAANALIGRKEAVKQAGTNAGEAYAYSVLPLWIRVSREYFVRGNAMFKVARRKAESGNWEGAGDIWHQQTTAAKRKAAGRACYNMAIINEINGNLDEAIRWAQQSYEDYNVKRALRYVRILEGRKHRNRILEEQTQVTLNTRQ